MNHSIDPYATQIKQLKVAIGRKQAAYARFLKKWMKEPIVKTAMQEWIGREGRVAAEEQRTFVAALSNARSPQTRVLTQTAVGRAYWQTLLAQQQAADSRQEQKQLAYLQTHCLPPRRFAWREGTRGLYLASLQTEGVRVYFLGAAENVLEAVSALRRDYPMPVQLVHVWGVPEAETLASALNEQFSEKRRMVPRGTGGTFSYEWTALSDADCQRIHKAARQWQKQANAPALSHKNAPTAT